MSSRQQPRVATRAGRRRRPSARAIVASRRWRLAAVVAMASMMLAACGGSRSLVAGRLSAARVSSAVSAGGSGASGSAPSRRQQERVLDAAYRRMREGKAGGGDPGPADVLFYGVGKLWSQGIDGAGTTIALLEGWDNPMLAKQLATFDTRVGLPNPRIRTILPPGVHTLPTTCPASVTKLDGGCAGWESEAYLDVISAHLMAPYARIDLVAAPALSGDAAEVDAQGNTNFMQALEAITRRHLADVVSVSGYSGESTYVDDRAEVSAEDPGELAAAVAGIPFVTITGDDGPAQPLADGKGVTRKRDVAVWADSPWSLAVGGSLTHRPPVLGVRRPGAGDKALRYPRLWPSTGAGSSAIFPRPSYQDGVARITHVRGRSVPDITMDAYHGTSEAAPLMAGVLALATQANGGHDLGPINTALYDVLGPRGAADGIRDIVRGDDTLGKVRGFTAHRGFDVASGWGTIDASRFVPALVRATRASRDERTARARAGAELAALRGAVHVAAAGGGSARLRATGFAPRFRVALSIDGRPVATLHADRHGDAEYTIDPGRLHLAAGSHTVALRGVLITVRGRFTTR